MGELMDGEKYKSSELDADFLEFIETYLTGQTVLRARSDKYSNLHIEFDKNISILVEDGPFENWYYTDQVKKFYLHGGCGNIF